MSNFITLSLFRFIPLRLSMGRSSPHSCVLFFLETLSLLKSNWFFFQLDFRFLHQSALCNWVWCFTVSAFSQNEMQQNHESVKSNEREKKKSHEKQKENRKQKRKKIMRDLFYLVSKIYCYNLDFCSIFNDINVVFDFNILTQRISDM